MKERYLHYLWQHKLIPLRALFIRDGTPIQIIHPGEYNEMESGPDFFNAQILIDTIRWVGNVEIHVKSSDWLKHRHHHDEAYDNVILHIVLSHDLPSSNAISRIPTLVLQNWINPDHLIWFNEHFKIKSGILCRSQLTEFQPIQAVFMMERTLYSRMIRKSIDLNKHRADPKQALFELLAGAMGSKVNQLPFLELAQKLKLNELKPTESTNFYDRIMNASGLFNDDTLDSTTFNENRVQKSSWKLKGVMHTSFPRIRVMQFAAIVSQYDFNYQFVYCSPEIILNYCKELIKKSKHKLIELGLSNLSDSFVNGLIINAFVPFIFWYGQLIQDEEICEKAFSVLRLLPPENNSVLKKWKNLKMPINNAGDSQALLEIYNQFCSHKKCLNCDIGKMILGR
ncbi:MAG: DUF2851 family protein [Flavobacteriia bacterium]|jgi:hypothetical protein